MLPLRNYSKLTSPSLNIYAGAFRNKSEKYGAWCYLCWNHHVGNEGVHTAKGTQYWNYLKKIAKSHFEAEYGKELFEKEFKGAYIERTKL